MRTRFKGEEREGGERGRRRRDEKIEGMMIRRGER